MAATWSAVGIVVQNARANRPSPESVVATSAAIQEADPAPEQIEQQLDEIIRTVQRLSPKERMRPEVQDALQRSFAAMSPDQQMELVESILPMGLEQMVAAYRDMGEDQKRLVTERLYQELGGRGWLPDGVDAPAVLEAILDENADKFLDAPDAATRLELLPEMQRVLHIMQAR